MMSEGEKENTIKAAASAGSEGTLRNTIKHGVLVAPSYVATVLINVPLILLMIWVLGWVFRAIHSFLMLGVDRIMVASPSHLVRLILANRVAFYITILLLVLLAISLCIEAHRVGIREAVATAVRGAVFVANVIYKIFRLVAELIWIIVGLVLLLFQRQGPREFVTNALEGIKESLSETR